MFPVDHNRFYSSFVSSAQRLPNGNTLITEGASGKITVSMASDAHNLTMVLLSDKAGIELTPVFYQSGSKALNALLGGHVDAAMAAVQFGAVARSQELPVIGVAGAKRLESLPESPTFKESGYDIQVTQSRILVAPKGTPRNIIVVFKSGM